MRVNLLSSIARFILVHQVCSSYSSVVANFGRMRDARRTNTRCGLGALVLLLLGIGHLAGAATVDDPAAILRNSVDEVLSIAYSGHGNDNLEARVRPSLEKCFAFDLVTRQAMGPGWRQFSTTDQKRVTDLFAQLVIRTYSARVVGTQRPKIVYGTPIELAADRREIPTRVTYTSGNEPFAVVYRLIKLPAGWRVYDVLIEGVSFVANYRGQFDGIIQKGGAPAVIRALESKLAAPADSRS
jgi:phospholipid transport system substrate-binding protein